MHDVERGDELLKRRPPRPIKEQIWKVERSRPKVRMTGTVISHDLLGVDLHWNGSRKTPCWLTDDCPYCRAGVPRNWYSYVAAIDVTGRDRALWEITPGALYAWDQAFCRHRTLRGLEFIATRENNKASGPVHMLFAPPRDASGSLPKAPDIYRMLVTMFGVPELFERTLRLIQTPIERGMRQAGGA